MNNQKRNITKTQVQEAARLYWQKLLNRKAIKHNTIQGRRLRAAAQQFMELADGEKPWVDNLIAAIQNNSRRRNFPISFCRTQWGWKGKRGEPYSYGFYLEKQEDQWVIHCGIVRAIGFSNFGD